MRILKILLLSTAIAAFGAGTALAHTAPPATTHGKTTVKPKTTAKKVVKKKTVVKKKIVKAKKTTKKKFVVAKAKKKPAPPADTDAAPGNPPPGSSTN